VPGGAGVTIVEAESVLNEEQLDAVEAEGSVFVSAGAGTGKTSVLVERYVRAVCDRGLDVESILVITYTRKAAGELRSRIRTALRERGRPDLARELDGAWISTIHGFCNRLLRAHPFAAGLDPRFRELEDAGAAVLRGEAFERALEAFCAGGDPERLRLLATYRADGLRRMLTGVYETLRSAGRDLVLELGERPSVEDAVRALRAEAEALAADASATETQRRNAGELLRVVTEGATPSASSTSARSGAAERAPRPTSMRGGRPSGRRSRTSRRTTATCSRSSWRASPSSTRQRSGASRWSTSRISSSRRATCCATSTPSARRPGCGSG
jgi:ATP-dependent helicase/nuclease subunit A